RRSIGAQPRPAGVAHDREQPRPRLAAQAVEMAVGAQHRFLEHVLGVVVVAREPAREVVRRVEMRQHKRLVARAVGHARTFITPLISSWPAPQKTSQANSKLPAFSGVNGTRATRPGTMSACRPSAGA